MVIRKKHVKIFSLIIAAYQESTRIPQKGIWKEYDNNQLWMRHIGQIMVVGGSQSKGKFDSNKQLQNLVHIDALKALPELKRMEIINQVLRKSDVRFASEDLGKCHKTKAVVHNFEFIQNYEGGLVGILKDFDLYTGDSAELDRVEFFKEHLMFIKNKSARDYLMGLGMNYNTLALDIRIKNIFDSIGIDFPSAAELGSTKIYNETEKKIIDNICKPLKIEPIVFDRILYQNYRKILSRDYLVPKLF